MQAIILAGGLGSRLRPITDYVPKPLIPVNNIPLIEWQIKQLKKFKINEFIICTGYKTEQIENYLEQKENFGSKIRYSTEKSPLGTGGAIKKAAKLIKEKSFLVINGDIITDIDVRKLYSNPNSIALVELRTKFGTVDLDDSKIVRFREKKPIENVWMNAGIYHLDKKLVAALPFKGAIEETTFRRFASKKNLTGIKFKDAFWHSIDSHKDLDECSKALKGKKI
ncbi:nucleotidyltransferase family protein [Candidatus Nitrosotenuis aquarius]|uniref:nucleotidyltransferase family protein n=1 Tax=Candidatus Nitrosotenuis aquarius TaxID=1846278 RepID=UPI000C1E1FC7|nr:nucleotidyltransferase family protein [Candidatus Nitrosotenuis aquarius]